MEVSPEESNVEAAVRIRGAYKRYGTINVILRGLNMTVDEGIIYGLLGPSGCGKTTLLHTIVGMSKLDSGEIKVKANMKSKIGYMPQEIALYNELTIIETMTYYGNIFGLSYSKIKSRTKEMSDLLELPSKNRLLQQMSGGQRRRVSLAVTLLHNPELIILDEPTVGIDPVICANIWEKLLQMVSLERKTIIITTHYIEEARQAHTIGLMRNGYLLAEQSPVELMNRFDCSSLEEVFLKLCEKQKLAQRYSLQTYPDPVECKSPFLPEVNCSLRRIIAQSKRNFYWTLRNKGIMMFLLLLPTVLCLIFNISIGHDPIDLKVAFMNEEIQNGSYDCSQLLSTGCNFSLPLSCRYLNVLENKKLKLSEYYDIDLAKKALKENKVWAFIHFAKNYSIALKDRLEISSYTDNIAVSFGEVNVWLDSTNKNIAEFLNRAFIYGFAEFLESLYVDCGWPPKVAEIPFSNVRAIYGRDVPSFTESTVPGLISTLVFYFPMAFTVAAIMMEKTAGLLERSLIAGMNLFEVLISHAVMQIALLVVQTASMLLVMFVVYDNLLIGSLSSISFLLFLTGMSGMCYGFVISLLSSTDTIATFSSTGSILPLLMLSGIVWPLEGVHDILVPIVQIQPIAVSAEAFRAITVKGWNILNPVVFKGFLVSLGWNLLFILITFYMVKKNKGFGSKR